MCYHAEFGRSGLRNVGIDTGEPQKWGALELRSLGMGSRRGTRTSPTCVTTSNLVVLRQRVYA